MLNRVVFAGFLTRDPEITYTPKGTAVVRYGIASNRRWKTAEGEQREEATFVEFQAWGKTAETIGQYFRKGQPIIVEGRLCLNQWEDKQTGEKRSKLYVETERFSFIPNAERRESAPSPKAPAKQATVPGYDPNDDVPF